MKVTTTVCFAICLSLAACVSWPWREATPPAVPFDAQIVFYSDRDAREEDVYVLDTNTRTVKRLTSNPGEDIRPFWSPRGDYIAYYSDQDGDLDIYVMDPDGSNPRNLTNNKGDDWGDVRWSPDGAYIAFSASVDVLQADIFVANTNDWTAIPVTESKVLAASPAWSPDGTRIAFAFRTSQKQGLAIRDLGSPKTVELLENESWVDSVDWSPDGDWIAFQSVREDGLGRIDVVKVDGSLRYESICGDMPAHSAVWSPDGEWIAFVGGPKDRDLSHLLIARKDGSDLTILVEDGVVDFPSWSPDGKWIAFTGESGRIDRRLGDLDIYAVNVETKEVYNLTASKGDDRDPDWRP